MTELSADLVNASAEEDELETSLALGRLFTLLDELEAIYGRTPSLLATRADFTAPSPDSCALLIEANTLAVENGDIPNQWLAAESLFEFYTDHVPDQREALHWMRAME